VFGPILESSRLSLTIPRALHGSGEIGARVSSRRGCSVRSLLGGVGRRWDGFSTQVLSARGMSYPGSKKQNQSLYTCAQDV
jgi:hypothetical protein